MAGKEFTRGAGILMSITSLPTAYGIGTMGQDAFDFVDLLVDLKQRYWQVLPLGPTSFGDSPYQSFSAFAGNPYLIDLHTLIKEKLITKAEVESLSWGNKEDDIDYAILFENRFKVLNSACGRFDFENEKFLKFSKEESYWLDDYSFFMAMKTFSNNDGWMDWKEEIRNRNDKSLNQYQKKLEKEIRFWKFCQFKFFEQWMKLKAYANKKGIQIIGDIPLYVALDSADVWVNREDFQLDKNGCPTLVAGCPPDAFSDDGQKWGNPLYDWDAMEQNGFAWWKKRMLANAKLYDVIRIDHFIGVVRYYSIPANDDNAKNGRWRKGPGKKLTDAIEEVLGDGKIIAEDLESRS